MLLRSGLCAFVCLLSLTSIILIVHLYGRKGAPSTDWIPHQITTHLPTQLTPQGAKTVENNCSARINWLDRKDRPSPFQYARREIIVRQSPTTRRALLTKIDETLFSKLQTVDLSADSSIQLEHCPQPLILDVPIYSKEPVDASNIIFGIQTTMKRLDDTIEALVRWLPTTRAKGAKLFVIVKESEEVEAGKEAMKKLESKMRAQDLDVTLLPPFAGDTFSERYFSLVKVMYDNRNDKTQWISLIDDDTFFPSLHSLLDMLAERDPKEQHYVGSLSEDWWSVSVYGLMGFGGAGVFLSMALAEVIDQNYAKCKEESDTTAGDIRVKECIYAHSNVKLTNIPELHQVDFKGDKSGYYESGHLPLSLHHWKDWSTDGVDYLLAKMHFVSDICGDCFMQRWQFGEDTILSNGFSVVIYPQGNLKDIDTDRMEQTWDDGNQVEGSINHGFDHSLGPARHRLSAHEKIQHMLLEAVAVDGGIRQSYLHEGKDGEHDTVLELFWKEEQSHKDEDKGEKPEGGDNADPSGIEVTAKEKKEQEAAEKQEGRKQPGHPG